MMRTEEATRVALDQGRVSERPQEQAAMQQPESQGRNQNTPTQHRRKKKKYAISQEWERLNKEGKLPKDINTFMCCCSRKIGYMHALCVHPDGSPIFIMGPCWPFCAFVTLPVILGTTGSVAYFVLYEDYFDLPEWVFYVYCSGVAVLLLALFCVACTDPGLMERVTDEEAGEAGFFWNEQVGSFRPPGALYCRECGVLIQGYDHLCPWTGTGIGKGNMWAFKFFVGSVSVMCYATIGVVAWALLDGFLS